MRVMIVEDEILIAMHLETILTEEGHEVCCTARDSAEALQGALNHRPDVVTMDLRLADGDCGSDVAAALKERFDLRCIFVSGNLDAGRLERLAALDPVGFVHKPVDARQLLKLVAQAETEEAARRAGEAFVPDDAAAAVQRD